MNVQIAFRRTGRTTKALEHALLLATSGQTVYFVVGDFHHVEGLIEHITSRFPRLIKSFNFTLGDVKVHNNGELRFRVGDSAFFDWELLRFRGQPSHMVTIVDHYAIEQHYGKILNAWMEYF
jgi:hypothetical protein